MINSCTQIYFLFFIYLYKFFTKLSLLVFFNKKLLFIINKKKFFFFKRRSRTNFLSSRRLIISLKRRKFKNFKSKKLDKGNFFFKKFFFKSLYKNRSFFKNFFFKNNKIRQSKITKLIFKNQKNSLHINSTYSYNLLNILIKSNLFISINDVFATIQARKVYVNGIINNSIDTNISVGDCIQLKISNSNYLYLLKCKKLIKKYVTLHRFNSWKFFKKKNLKKKIYFKLKKRKSPKYLNLLFLFKVNTPKFLEIDYLTLTIFLICKKLNLYFNNFYFNKFFSFKFFSLYNFKKIN